MNLENFCAGKDEIRDYLQEPFGVDGKIVYTNGHIMVWVKGTAKAGKDSLAKNVEKIMSLGFSDCTITEMPDIEDLEVCEGCEGTGKAQDCLACDGCGCHVCDLGFEHSCENCNKHGLIPGEDKCPICDGYKYTNTVPVFQAHIDYRYLRKIFELPNARIGKPLGKEKAYPFVFDGGQGAVMPIRKK